MARYTVTTVVECDDQAEYDDFLAHLAAKNVNETLDGPFESVDFDEPLRKVTLVRVQQVKPPDWN
jgi:hypothetical protein